MTESIPILQPDTFRQLLMADIDHPQLDKPHFNRFYIHDLSKDMYKLKLPLPPHRKTVNDFVILTSGKMTKTAGLDNYEVAENSIFILPVGQITTTQTISKDINGFYCHFSNDFIAEYNSHVAVLHRFPFLDWLKNPVLKLSAAEMKTLISLLARIETIYANLPNFELIRSYLITFLTELKISKSIQNKVVLSSAERIACEFKQALERNARSFRTIDQYAQLLNITPNHLNKCVKKVFGKPVSLIIDEMLVLEAKILLQQPSTAISEVGFDIGFEDPSYFGRFFKKKTGFTPTEFRKMIDLSD